MISALKQFLHAYVPSHFHDPFGLLIRIIRRRDRAAYFAVVSAVAGVLLVPLDLILGILERRIYRGAPHPLLPLIIIVGAPRSGTTLAEQLLINNLQVTFLNNLTSLFPRAPIIANRLFGWLIRQRPTLEYKSYYGKTQGLGGPNDALYIWDRWLGQDRRVIPASLAERTKESMAQFFGAWEQAFQLPLVAKNNNLNVYASMIAEVLETAYFICMTRDPVYLAQSLLEARLEIHGDNEKAYGLDDPNQGESQGYIEDVCRQVAFHAQGISEQQRLIGRKRFWIVRYEDLCANPEGFVKRVSEEILKQPVDTNHDRQTLAPFTSANRMRIDPGLFAQLKEALSRLNGDAYERYEADRSAS